MREREEQKEKKKVKKNGEDNEKAIIAQQKNGYFYLNRCVKLKSKKCLHTDGDRGEKVLRCDTISVVFLKLQRRDIRRWCN